MKPIESVPHRLPFYWMCLLFRIKPEPGIKELRQSLILDEDPFDFHVTKKGRHANRLMNAGCDGFVSKTAPPGKFATRSRKIY